MAKAKYVSIALEKKYIQLDKDFKKMKDKHEAAKKQLLHYYAKGYLFHIITPTDTSAGVFCPPWKKIAMELVAKLFKTERKRKHFFKELAERFPRQERNPTLCYPGMRRETPKEE